MNDKRGACNTGRKAIVSAAFPHFGEESVLQVGMFSNKLNASACVDNESGLLKE
jgi:uncharacterized Fe-S radical SAM superfamily protein PflX